jgi:hypothetical protein
VKVEHGRRCRFVGDDYEQVVVRAALDLDFLLRSQRLQNLWNGTPVSNDQNSATCVLGAEAMDQPVRVFVGMNANLDADGFGQRFGGFDRAPGLSRVDSCNPGILQPLCQLPGSLLSGF